jgi:hypothetical protein
MTWMCRSPWARSPPSAPGNSGPHERGAFGQRTAVICHGPGTLAAAGLVHGRVPFLTLNSDR